MAAQKLTKGRFVQIIIMLTLLIVAFFWRTITYQDVIKVDCEGKNTCSFKVNETEFTAKFEAEMLSISTQNSGWTIHEANLTQEKPMTWQIAFKHKQQISLTNNAQEETYRLEITNK
ncbi:hypothetical protein [Vibrio rhodolitus]|uniref:hypothetical protein n=1 Tax=Vibrio rhodolitus TaxID=2231649 RepID=UPI000E0BE61B|nr:hypothetical protein [Vibrio rhodolitus]